jgi:NadR type nicotinamide-nucleotide adenylyltransferase
LTIKKFVIVGPESTGKSTLSQNLAAHFNTEWVREYAREYLEKNGTDYTFENLLDIAKGQLTGEDEAVKKLKECTNKVDTVIPLIIDTDLYVIKVWSEFVFNKCDNSILTEITKRKYDGYLLCNTDVPWVKDNLREYPDLVTREKLFHYYKEELSEQNVPWVIISGNYEERLQNAIAFIEALL